MKFLPCTPLSKAAALYVAGPLLSRKKWLISPDFRAKSVAKKLLSGVCVLFSTQPGASLPGQNGRSECPGIII
jgi:hypothetical protein